MHEDPFAIDAALVARLIDAQFPDWSSEPIRRIETTGTVHEMYRLGSDRVVRLPRSAPFSPPLEREAALLPMLAPHLPVRVPAVLGVGAPSEEFPASWSVMGWIDGVSLDRAPDTRLEGVAERLGAFLAAMWAIDLDGERSSNQRGRSLATAEAWMRRSVDAVAGEFDRNALLEVWEAARGADPWDGVDRWIHGDPLPGNLVVARGTLVGVIDFGECGLGNPTHDLIAGWWTLDAGSRPRFREATRCTDAMWERARGWAVTSAAGALAHYRESNRAFADQARRTLTEVLADAA